MKIKINLEEMHGIGVIIIDIQSAACEVLINLLISCPEIFYNSDHEEDSATVLDIVLKALKHQKYTSRFVECGLRFLALYAKNYPQILRKVLNQHQANQSFVELVESVRDQEMIAHGLSICSAIFSTPEHSKEDNEQVLKLLMYYLKSNNLRVI
jgi:hypothetical protein